MRYLKSKRVFESQDQTSRICQEFGIENWSINEGLVDVNGNVDLRNKGLEKLPLKFGSVSGYFLCNMNQLTSLEGAPERVGSGFYCGDNPVLTSFDWVPKRLGAFLCRRSPIWNIWSLFGDWEELDFFNECDPIRGSSIDLNRLNYFLETIGKEPVQTVRGYNILN